MSMKFIGLEFFASIFLLLSKAISFLDFKEEKVNTFYDQNSLFASLTMGYDLMILFQYYVTYKKAAIKDQIEEMLKDNNQRREETSQLVNIKL